MYPRTAWKRNDGKAKKLIYAASIIVFLAVLALGRVEMKTDLGFDPHLFAKLNAFINGTVAVLLLAALLAVRAKNYIVHKRLMITALILSCLFLISYVCHHLFTGETSFGGSGSIRYVYFFILITHIFLAAIILPFILFTTYRAMTGQWEGHRKSARITWPIWFYVAISGVLVYLLISPYY